MTGCPTTPASRASSANRGEGGTTTSRPTSPTTADSPRTGAETHRWTVVSTIDRHRRNIPRAGHADGHPPLAWSAARPHRPGDTERGRRRRRTPSDRLIVHHRRPTRLFSRSDGAPTVSVRPSASSSQDWQLPFITVANIRLSAHWLPCALRRLYANQAYLSFFAIPYSHHVPTPSFIPHVSLASPSPEKLRSNDQLPTHWDSYYRMRR